MPSNNRRMILRRTNAELALLLSLSLAAIMGCNARGAAGSPGFGNSSPSKGAGGDFEGVITMKWSGAEFFDGVQMVYYVKKNRMRTETSFADDPDMQDVLIEDASAATVTHVWPKDKMYMTMDLKEVAAGGPGKGRTFPKLTQTGKSETIAGYACEHYVMDDEQNVDICVAKGLGYFVGGGIAMTDMIFSEDLKTEAAGNPVWVKFLDGGAFPLKLTRVEHGKATVVAQVTSIEPRKLDDSLFVVPPDYKGGSLGGAAPPIQGKKAR